MSQMNPNFQEILTSNNSNANGLENVAGTTILTSEALQGFSMANQFAICANPGNTPVLLSCLAPMFVPTISTSKSNFEITNQDSRAIQSNTNQQQIGQQPQTVQIQLATPINIANNLCNANNAAAQTLPPLGLSYINLSSLGAAGGGAIPIQITLNNPNNNQQLHLPAGALSGLNQEIQLAGGGPTYHVKYEPDTQGAATNNGTITLGHHPQQQQQQHQQQQADGTTTLVALQTDGSNNINNGTTNSSNNNNNNNNNRTVSMDNKPNQGTRRKPRRRIPNKSKNMLIMSNGGASANDENGQGQQQQGQQQPGQQQPGQQQQQQQMDHKGRPFIYSCPHCPKRFTLNSRLTAHLRCHTGIRPYTCVQCGFSFTQKSYLIRHAAVHTEDRPFTCERCFKTYKHYGSLANHRKLHRKEDKAAAASAMGLDDDGILDDEGGGGGGGGGGTSSSLVEDHVGEIINMVVSGSLGGSLSWQNQDQHSNDNGGLGTDSNDEDSHSAPQHHHQQQQPHPTYLGAGPTAFPSNGPLVTVALDQQPSSHNVTISNSASNQTQQQQQQQQQPQQIYLDIQQRPTVVASQTPPSLVSSVQSSSDNPTTTILYTTNAPYTIPENSSSTHTTIISAQPQQAVASHLHHHTQHQPPPAPHPPPPQHHHQHYHQTFNTSSAI